jgi:hypothetical protein
VAAPAVRAVQITATVLNPSIRTMHRTVTARAAITRLARMLNGLPAAPAGTWPCPAIATSYRLTFEPASGGRPAIVVRPTGCLTDSVAVGSRLAPPLWDPGERLIRLARVLLRR